MHYSQSMYRSQSEEPAGEPSRARGCHVRAERACLALAERAASLHGHLLCGFMIRPKGPESS